MSPELEIDYSKVKKIIKEHI